MLFCAACAGGMPAHDFYLLHCSRLLKDGKCLGDYGICGGSNVRVTIVGQGGAQVRRLAVRCVDTNVCLEIQMQSMSCHRSLM